MNNPIMGPKIMPRETVLLKMPMPVPSFPSGMKSTASVACAVVMEEKAMPCVKRTSMKMSTPEAARQSGKHATHSSVEIMRTRCLLNLSAMSPDKGRKSRAMRGNTAMATPMTVFWQCMTSIR